MVNVEVVQDDLPATLNMTGNLHNLLGLRTTTIIKPGDQLWLFYGPVFWAKTKRDEHGRPKIDCTV